MHRQVSVPKVPLVPDAADGDEHSSKPQKALRDVGMVRRTCAVEAMAEWAL